MSKYLYGVSVQGIQDFIFKTNKLQEIVGASEIVKSIASKFLEFVAYEKEDERILVNAAGNIKVVLNEQECEKVVLNFPKEIMLMAYGITLSQAVVKIEGHKVTPEEINELEKRLKVQRNRPSKFLDLGLNIMKLNPSTSKPVVDYMTIQQKSTPVDKATQQKLKAYKKFKELNPKIKEFGIIASFSNAKNKIAVIHADGNGLGAMLPRLHKEDKNISEFSRALDEATKKAFERAKNDSMSIRDVILGGDDMVVICNANDALPFTQNFLRYFEEETEKNLGSKLTACAGIAYSNEKYPFHYAVALAEELCDATKKHAKKIDENLAPSSLMFHNIQSSNFHSWDKFIVDELTIQNDSQSIRCDFGPYYLDQENQALIGDFMNMVAAYRCDGSPISKLRAWIGELHNSSQYAQSMLERINIMAEQSSEWKSCIMEKNLQRFDARLSNEQLIIQKDGYEKTPIYDVLQVVSATEVK